MIVIDYQRIPLRNDLRLPLGNGAAKREQSQIHLNSAEQASHLKTEFYNGAVSDNRVHLLDLCRASKPSQNGVL